MLTRTYRAHLTRSMERRRWRERDVVYGTVVSVGPHGDAWVTLPGSSTPVYVGTTAGGVTFKPGSTVPLLNQSGDPGTLEIAGLPAPGRKGAAEFPLVTPSPDLADVWGIIRAVPSTLNVGQTDQEVTVFGWNLSAADTFRPVIWDSTANDWADDPDATVHDVVLVDDEEVTLQIDVASGRPLAGHVTLQPRRAWEG